MSDSKFRIGDLVECIQNTEEEEYYFIAIVLNVRDYYSNVFCFHILVKPKKHACAHLYKYFND